MYYPRATLRFLKEFREAWQSGRKHTAGPTKGEALLDWQKRGLLPEPVWPEQMDILELLTCDDLDEIDKLGQRLSKRYARNFAGVEKLDRWTKSCDPARGQALIQQMKQDKDVSPFIEDLVTHNVRVLSGLPRPPRGEGKRDSTRRWDDYE